MSNKFGEAIGSTRGLGLANVVAALDVGVTTFDSSLGGLGGCPFAPGASGNIGTQVALRANPDGHTLFMNSSAIAVNVSLYAKPGYAMKDIAPILQGPTTPNLITVHPSVKAKTLQELIGWAKGPSAAFLWQ